MGACAAGCALSPHPSPCPLTCVAGDAAENLTPLPSALPIGSFMFYRHIESFSTTHPSRPHHFSTCTCCVLDRISGQAAATPIHNGRLFQRAQGEAERDGEPLWQASVQRRGLEGTSATPACDRSTALDAMQRCTEKGTAAQMQFSLSLSRLPSSQRAADAVAAAAAGPPRSHGAHHSCTCRACLQRGHMRGSCLERQRAHAPRSLCALPPPPPPQTLTDQRFVGWRRGGRPV